MAHSRAFSAMWMRNRFCDVLKIRGQRLRTCTRGLASLELPECGESRYQGCDEQDIDDEMHAVRRYMVAKRGEHFCGGSLSVIESPMRVGSEQVRYPPGLNLHPKPENVES